MSTITEWDAALMLMRQRELPEWRQARGIEVHLEHEVQPAMVAAGLAAQAGEHHG